MTSLEKPIKWFYVFSPRYEIFHIILRSLIGDNPNFDVKPIKVPQEAFSNTYKEGASHFLSGNSVKFKVLLDIMSNLPEGEQFIFSDADIFIQNLDGLIKLIKMHKDDELVFMHENENDNYKNIGFGLMKNTENNRWLHKEAMNRINTDCALDQDAINAIIGEYPEKYGAVKTFPRPEVSQSNFADVGSSYMFQMLCSSKDPDANIFEKLISAACASNIVPLKEKIQPNIWNTLIIWMKKNHPTNPLASESFVIPVISAVLGVSSIPLQAVPK